MTQTMDSAYTLAQVVAGTVAWAVRNDSSGREAYVTVQSQDGDTVRPFDLHVHDRTPR